MYDKSLEPMSAMMDSEIEEFELRRVIERTANNSQLVNKWNRYHLVQDVMKGRLIQIPGNVDLASRVSQALDDEPALSSQAIAKTDQSLDKALEPSLIDRWWKPAASMAVAASVTAVVLLGAQQFSVQPSLSIPSEFAGVSLGADDFDKGKFSTKLATVSANNAMLRAKKPKNAYGMEQYIQRHNDLTNERSATWQATWLPQGYKQVDQRVSSRAEVMLFSNGESSVSVNVEPLGLQVASQGVLSKGQILAYGVSVDKQFITVVGEISAQQAHKIAAAIQPTQK